MFSLRRSRDDLVAVLGEPQFVEADSNGLGLMDVWLVRFECGLEMALWWFHAERCVPSPTDAPRFIELHASESERSHLLFHLELTPDEISVGEPCFCAPGEALWRVVRLDDNGNVFEVTRVASQCEAEHIAGDFERRGHKQTYSVERVTG